MQACSAVKSREPSAARCELHRYPEVPEGFGHTYGPMDYSNFICQMGSKRAFALRRRIAPGAGADVRGSGA